MNDHFQTHPQVPIDVEYRVTGEESGGWHRPPEPKEPDPRINLLLFLATLFTTTYAGALMAVGHPVQAFSQLYRGLPFSITLLLILVFHEFGHYFMAKKHHVKATLPYFIPAPSIIGTFGAVIKMRSPLYSKRALLDIGAAGPLAGVTIAIPATIVGLYLSEIKSLASVAEGSISLGSSLLFALLSRIVLGTPPETYDVVLHPVAFAGWIGLLVTMLNLIPVGQLDGGHVAYAVLGRWRHRVLAYTMLPLMFFLGIQAWPGWIVWCVLLLFVLGTKHPPTMDESLPLDPRRKLIGWIALFLFVLTFTPAPFSF